jgi:hypothetical protein
MLDEFTTIIL